MTDQTEPSGNPPEILIVEDSPVEAEMLRRILMRGGYRVYKVAQNGKDGLQALREHPCALVMSNINMPLMDGFELCHTIKLDEKLWGTPVILVASLSEPKDIIKALDVGVDGYVTKPYVENILLGRIRSLLANPATRKLADERRKIQLEFGGEKHSIAVGSPQVANLMLSVYENSLILNQKLLHIQNQLTVLNEGLDEKVRERTKALATAALEAQQKTEQIRILFENNADGILVVDQEGRISSANPAAAQLFGKTQDALLGSRFEATLVEGEALETTIPCGADETREVGIHNAKILWEGQPAQLVTLRDITQHKRTGAKLNEQLNELRRWQKAMEGREMRILDLKREVNVLLAQAGKPPHYSSTQQLDGQSIE